MGLKASWAAQTTIPGGWNLDPNDKHIACGDIDGDSKNEMVIVSSAYTGLVRYNTGSNGLTLSWIAKDKIS
jgi:hypothetical protein